MFGDDKQSRGSIGVIPVRREAINLSVLSCLSITGDFQLLDQLADWSCFFFVLSAFEIGSLKFEGQAPSSIKPCR
jgi:hypothetical protein